MRPLVSVVIPLFNKEKWIEKTLLSVLNQSFTNWEVIIVDDGSTDKSVEVVENFIINNPGNWTLLKNKNSGQCRTRNSGIAKANGEFIAFLDADDIWSKNKLLDQVKILKANNEVSLVISPYIIFSDSNKDLNHRLVLHKDAKRSLDRWIKMKGYGAGTESSGMTRVSLVKDIGGFDEELSTSAGLDLSIKLANRGTVVFSNQSLMAYRIHTGQWHSNIEVLSRDMAALRTRPIEILGQAPKSLNFWHSAYINIAKSRQGDNFLSDFFLTSIFGKEFQFKIILISNILARNVISRIRGRFAKQICGFSTDDFEEFVSSF
jgi:glycosyltransferase involved in cell wall biosynthesis